MRFPNISWLNCIPNILNFDVKVRFGILFKDIDQVVHSLAITC